MIDEEEQAEIIMVHLWSWILVLLLLLLSFPMNHLMTTDLSSDPKSRCIDIYSLIILHMLMYAVWCKGNFSLILYWWEFEYSALLVLDYFFIFLTLYLSLVLNLMPFPLHRPWSWRPLWEEMPRPVLLPQACAEKRWKSIWVFERNLHLNKSFNLFISKITQKLAWQIFLRNLLL